MLRDPHCCSYTSLKVRTFILYKGQSHYESDDLFLTSLVTMTGWLMQFLNGILHLLIVICCIKSTYAAVDSFLTGIFSSLDQTLLFFFAKS